MCIIHHSSVARCGVQPSGFRKDPSQLHSMCSEPAKVYPKYGPYYPETTAGGQIMTKMFWADSFAIERCASLPLLG